MDTRILDNRPEFVFFHTRAANHISSKCAIIQHDAEIILRMRLSNYELLARMGLYDQYRRRGQDQRGQLDQQMVNAILPQRDVHPETQNNDQRHGR